LLNEGHNPIRSFHLVNGAPADYLR
jgi:hypothetical protein